MSTERNKEEIFISAAPGSRRFDKINEAVGGAESQITGYQMVATIDGQERSETIGTYNKQRFPGSRQSTIPFWSADDNQYIFRRADGTIWTQADLNKAVQDIPMNYPQWSPKAGERIMESNLTNFEDVYINRFRRELFEGEDTLIINQSSGRISREKVFEDMMRGNRAFMDETADEIRSSEVEFIIRNPQISEDREVAVREDKEQAFEYYTAMTSDPDRMRNILYMFGTDTEESVSTKTLRNLLFKKVDDNVTRQAGNTLQKLFCQYSNLPPDELALKAVIAKASIRRILVDRAGAYEFEGTVIAGTYEGVVEYFRKAEHAPLLDAIKMRMERK